MAYHGWSGIPLQIWLINDQYNRSSAKLLPFVPLSLRSLRKRVSYVPCPSGNGHHSRANQSDAQGPAKRSSLRASRRRDTLMR